MTCFDDINRLFGDRSYETYAANRREVPGITPRSWMKVYGEAAVNEMEARFQAELAAEKAAA